MLSGRFRRLPPVVVDGIMAVGLLAIDLSAFLPAPRALCDCVRDSDALGVAILMLGSLPVMWRRRFPITALFLTFAALTMHEALGFPEAPILGPYFAVYSVGAYRDRRPSAVAAGIAIAAYYTAFLAEVIRHDIPVFAVAPNFVLVLLLWGLGASVRTTRLHAAAQESRAERLEREREEHARRVAADERACIARELHDVVAHNVSVMVLQAGGARRVLPSRPDRTREALESIERTGRQALTEMRRLLGILRKEDQDSGPLEPQPGMDGLDRLVSRFEEAGLPVEVQIEGRSRPLPAGIDLSAYRIVQEALTNTLRHAGRARARVLVRFMDTTLEVEIADDGRGVRAEVEGDGLGQGLIGMRERAVLLGGELRAGSRPGGGYSVVARLPLESPSA
jgi:signal transduction histidine kinase